jgi:hypothetical protein
MNEREFLKTPLAATVLACRLPPSAFKPASTRAATPETSVMGCPAAAAEEDGEEE